MVGCALHFPVFDVADVRLRGFVAHTGLPAQDAALAGEHQVRIQALFLDHAGNHAVQFVNHRVAFVVGFPFVAGVGNVALLAVIVHAEFHFDGTSHRTTVRHLEAGFGILGIHRQGFGFGRIPFAVDDLVLFLGFGTVVFEPRVVQIEPGGAVGYVEPVFGTDAPVLLVDRVKARHVGFDHIAIVVFDLMRNFGHVAVGSDVEGVDAEATGIAHLDGVGGVGRSIAAILHFHLILPADQFFHRRILEAIRTLVFGTVAILYVDTGKNAATQGVATGHRAEGRVDLAVVPAVHAKAYIAAIEHVGIAQHDVDRTGGGIAAAVGAAAAQDLDAIHHFRRDAIHPERTIIARTWHLLAVDQHLRVAARHAAQLRAIELHDVGADEGHAWHALQHVADGVRLEALEVFQAIHQGWRGVRGAIAVGDFALHHDGIEISRLLRIGRSGISKRSRGNQACDGTGQQVLLEVHRGCPLRGEEKSRALDVPNMTPSFQFAKNVTDPSNNLHR